MTAVPAADRRLLPEGLTRLGLPAETLAPRLEAYLDLLERWNRAYNLTAVRRREEMVPRHLLDSLGILPFLGNGPLADLGSGAGLPGIPLALARPGLALTLIEANGKKARFLREAVRRLGLERVRVAECRAENLDEPGAYGCLVARAFGTLAELLRAGGHLLGPCGRLLAMKGRLPEEELAGLPPGWRVEAVHRLDVPGLAAERHLVIVGRIGERPARADVPRTKDGPPADRARKCSIRRSRVRTCAGLGESEHIQEGRVQTLGRGTGAAMGGAGTP